MIASASWARQHAAVAGARHGPHGRLEMDLDAVERLVAERDCERLMVDYARRLDLGEPERVAELFTDDGVWEMTGRLRFEGKDQLRAAFATRMVAPGRT